MKVVSAHLGLSLGLVLLCGLANHAAAHEHVCKTPKRTAENLKTQHLRVANLAQQRADPVYPNLRIAVHFDESITTLPDKDEIAEFTQKAMDFWSTSLLVKYPLTENITIDRNCGAGSVSTNLTVNGVQRTCCVGDGGKSMCSVRECYGAIFPEEILKACCWCRSNDPNTCIVEGKDGPGVEADMLMLAIAKPIWSCEGPNSALAYASDCYSEGNYNRPVVGMVNLCPMVIDHSSGLDPFSEIQLLKHEIAHALGFSSDLYRYYRAADGSALSLPLPNGTIVTSDKVVRKVKRQWETINGNLEREFTLIVTPTVVQKLREYYNCDSIEGAELENHGSGGTAGSHFEMRLFASEAMSGRLTEWQNVSEISLALMQDTGWYMANFSNAEEFTHGKGLGCSFATDSCLTWIREKRAANQLPTPYCDTLSTPSASPQERRGTCYSTHDRVALCAFQVHENNSIDPMYHYFNETVPNGLPTDLPWNYGGHRYADYCPYLRMQRLGSSDPARLADRYRVCKNTNAQVDVQFDRYLETYGPSSICLRQATPVRLSTCNKTVVQYSDGNSWGAGCYEVVCGEQSVIIRAQGTTIHRCTVEHEVFSFESTVQGRIYQGTLVCPSCDAACGTNTCPLTKASTDGVDGEHLFEIATSRHVVNANVPPASRCRGSSFGPQVLAILLLLFVVAVARK